MTISLENQNIVVVGGSKRLGKAIALECALSGANVQITYNRSRREAIDTTGEMTHIGKAHTRPGVERRFSAAHLDVTKEGAVDNFVAQIEGNGERIHGLVICAAMFERTPFEMLSEAAFDAHIATNLKGPFLLCRAFGAHFLKQGGGSIVNFSDIYAQRPLANYIPYCASKAGVEMLTKGFAKALAPTVRVNCIAPGTILPPSEFQNETDDEAMLIKRIPMGRMGTPQEIAQTVVFLLGGPAFITGAIIPVDGAQILR